MFSQPSITLVHKAMTACPEAVSHTSKLEVKLYIQLPVLNLEGIGKLYLENDLAGEGSAFLILGAIPWNSDISAIGLLIYSSFVSFHHYCFSCSLIPAQ